jgi:hypothetical protein
VSSTRRVRARIEVHDDELAAVLRQVE